jgi:HlyD family secretion protein
VITDVTDKEAHTVDIEAEIDRPETLANLLPGYNADVEVILAKREDVLRIPTQNVLNGDRVLLLVNGLIEERRIELGVSNWEYTEVTSGLAADETVVVSVDRQGVATGNKAIAE